jgi:membrane protein required for colicin V production
MPTFNELTSFDLAVACIFALFLARGAWIGLVRQLAAFLALVGSYLLAARYAVQFSPLAGQFVANPRLTFFISFAVIFLVAAKLRRGVMVLTLLGWFDRLLGLVLGGVKALVVCSLVYMALASTLSTTNDLLRRSWSSPWLKEGATVLQALIDDPRVRQYFQQKEPAILNQLLPAKAAEKPAGGEGTPASR